MSTIPEGADTVSGEGADLRSAILDAASKLDIPSARVGYNLDLSHFRNTAGGSVARTTVKVVAWARSEDEMSDAKPDAAPAKERAPRPERAPRAPAAKEAPKGAAGGTNEASEKAKAWLHTLLGHMNINGTVEASGDDERVHLVVECDKAGRLIGRRGVTMHAVRTLLRKILADHGDPVIDVDVNDERSGEEDAKPRRKDRDDDRGGRGRRDDDRGGRGGRRDDDRGGRGGRGGGGRGRRDDDQGGIEEGKLRKLARRAAEKALETGKAFTLNVKLNSYDRRIVHLEVSGIDGVDSESVIKDDVKYIKVFPVQD